MNFPLYFVPAIIAAIVSILVVFLGRRSETKKHLESLRTTAYVDFVRGVAGLAVLQKHRIDSEEEFLKGSELTMLVADAKARIVLYGSKAVFASLAEFLRGGVVLDTPERGKQFTAICQKMRTDTRPRLEKVTDHDAHFLLFASTSKVTCSHIPTAKYRKTYRKTLPDDAESGFFTVTVPNLNY